MSAIFGKQVFFILASGIPLMNRIDLLALTLVGPAETSPVPDPLAVLHLDNQLYMLTKGHL